MGGAASAVSNAVSSTASNVSNAASNVVSGVSHGDVKQVGQGVLSVGASLNPGQIVGSSPIGQLGASLPGVGGNIAAINNSLGSIAQGNFNRASLQGGAQGYAALGGGGLLNGVGADLGVDPSLVGAFKAGMSGGPSSIGAARDPAGGVAVAPVQGSNSKLLMAAIVGGLVLIFVLKRRRK